MQLKNIQILTATLTLESGLHIGAGDSEIHIGGIDNSVVKHPISGEPYIPGSSLKGKIRSLLIPRVIFAGKTRHKCDARKLQL